MKTLVKWCVYKHTNRIDGKSYVGRCRYPHYEYRWNNGKGYERSPRFYAAIQEYGWDSFEHSILFSGLTLDEANRLERDMIEKYKTTDPEHGYNVCIGGDAFFAGQHHSEQTKKRISEKMKAYEKTSEHRKHISESKSGVKHHFAKSVCQLTKDGKLIKIWDYMAQASEELKINKANISSCCQGNRKTAGGYKWTYERV